MENKNERYTFGGFTFGSQNLFNLTIRVRNHAEYGTSNTVEMGIELTPEERQELITILINAGKEDN
jgi:hypothetical protein